MADHDLIRASLLKDRERVVVQRLDDYSYIIWAGVCEADGSQVMRCAPSVVRKLCNDGTILGAPHLTADRTYIHQQARPA